MFELYCIQTHQSVSLCALKSNQLTINYFYFINHESSTAITSQPDRQMGHLWGVITSTSDRLHLYQRRVRSFHCQEDSLTLTIQVFHNSIYSECLNWLILTVRTVFISLTCVSGTSCGRMKYNIWQGKYNKGLTLISFLEYSWRLKYFD